MKTNGSENSLLVVDQNEDQNEVSVEDESSDDSNDPSIDPFIPSNEWQPIRKGQVIPAGLHVRINLETGLKEAKALDQNKEEIDKNVKFIDRHKKVTQIRDNDNKKLQSIKELLKNMKFNGMLSEMSKDIDKTQDSGHNISENFRSIDEIKKDFKEMNIKMRSESEVLIDLLKSYNKSQNDQKIRLLSEMEYLVHSLDSAQDFVKFNGLQSLLPDLNSTDSRLRAQIAFTIGSATNGNPMVQIEAFKLGTLKELLFLLRSDPSFDVKKKCLFAISCLVRQFPSAQNSLVKEYGGLSIFEELFKESDINSIKLSAKVVTLLNDLYLERELTSKYGQNDDLTQLKLKQYHEIDLKEAITGHRFCALIPNLLNSEDNEVIEKTIEAMNSFSNICKNDFKKSLTLLRKICDKFEVLSKSETNESDLYFTNLFKMSSNLIKKLDSVLRDEF